PSGLTRPSRISSDCDARADIPRHHAAGADQRAVADRDAGQEDGAAADPDVAADSHRAAELQAGFSRIGVARVVGRVDLHGGPDLGAVADDDLDDVENDAIEVEEDAVAEADVIA